MSFIAAAIISSVAAVGSAVIGSRAARSAANAQADAANQANQTQWDMYNQNRTDMTPWREAGGRALTQLDEGLQEGGRFNRDFTMEDYQKDPGYDFRLSEGMKALERSRAARGNMFGGAAGKAMTRYAQDYASGEYTNAFNRYMIQRNAQYNRLAGVSGTGQTATEQLGNQGVAVAGQVGQNLIGAGNARASGYVGQANAINGAIGSGVNAYSQWQQYMRASNPNYSGGTFNPYYNGGTAADPAYG